MMTCQYDEMIPAGRDFRNRDVVEQYDAYHRRFRDIDAENAALVSALGLDGSQTIADFGCGTGAFALHAARHCAWVHAVDVSPAMLDYTQWRAQEAGVTNITCHHAGFLTYVHREAPLDAITTSMVLHHLPDFWKQTALCRLYGMLKPGGRLYIADVVFGETDYEATIAAWIEEMRTQVSEELGRDLDAHLRTEYSTFGWIMEGIIQRAGFRIDDIEYNKGVLAKYFCTREG